MYTKSRYTLVFDLPDIELSSPVLMAHYMTFKVKDHIKLLELNCTTSGIIHQVFFLYFDGSSDHTYSKEPQNALGRDFFAEFQMLAITHHQDCGSGYCLSKYPLEM